MQTIQEMAANLADAANEAIGDGVSLASGNGWVETAAAAIRPRLEKMLEEAVDSEQARWQQRIDPITAKYYPERDGTGTDTSDPLDVTAAEISQSLAHVAEHAKLAAQKLPLPLEEAKKRNVCRLCGQTPTVPTILNFGHEFACEKCLYPAGKPIDRWKITAEAHAAVIEGALKILGSKDVNLESAAKRFVEERDALRADIVALHAERDKPIPAWEEWLITRSLEFQHWYVSDEDQSIYARHILEDLQTALADNARLKALLHDEAEMRNKWHDATIESDGTCRGISLENKRLKAELAEAKHIATDRLTRNGKLREELEKVTGQAGLLRVELAEANTKLKNWQYIFKRLEPETGEVDRKPAITEPCYFKHKDGGATFYWDGIATISGLGSSATWMPDAVQDIFDSGTWVRVPKPVVMVETGPGGELHPKPVTGTPVTILPNPRVELTVNDPPGTVVVFDGKNGSKETIQDSSHYGLELGKIYTVGSFYGIHVVLKEQHNKDYTFGLEQFSVVSRPSPKPDYRTGPGATYKEKLTSVDAKPTEQEAAPTPEPAALLSLTEAQKRCRCRICGLRVEANPPYGPAMPFVLNFGAEHAHESCLNAWRGVKAKEDELVRLRFRVVEAEPEVLRLRTQLTKLEAKQEEFVTELQRTVGRLFLVLKQDDPEGWEAYRGAYRLLDNVRREKAAGK